jgi:phosphatidyl-myo-inositol dimannoside synthase
LSYLQQIILKEGLEDFTRTPGFISEEEVAFLFHRCEIYVSPSYEHQMDIEGFGMSFAEASACAKPVIGGNSGGVSDAIQDGKTGLLVSTPDADQLQKALEKLLRDKQLQSRLGSEGKRWAETAFAPNVLGKKMTAVLQKN